VVVGERDFKGTQLWARRLADQAPHARFEVLAEADHFPMFSAPQHFERIVRAALGTPW
jgi:pimeloyl-ACP methyl ester carboxylesterase